MTLREKAMINKALRLEREIELKEILTNNKAVTFVNKNNNDRIAIFHISSRSNWKYQISFIDSRGAEMDMKSNTIDEMIQDFIGMYYTYNIVKEVM